MRINGFRNLAVRSVPLVKAVKAYEQKYGEPPVALEALVPEFLESVPATGMAAYPKYIYRRGEEKRCDGNPWVLEVFAPSGILNFDRFYYYPLQNYPESVCSDRVERVGDWAYWHE